MVKSPWGQISRHGFPAEDGVKPGLAGWESSEKPKTLGKCSHGGTTELTRVGFHLAGNALGLEFKKSQRSGCPPWCQGFLALPP